MSKISFAENPCENKLGRPAGNIRRICAAFAAVVFRMQNCRHPIRCRYAPAGTHRQRPRLSNSTEATANRAVKQTGLCKTSGAGNQWGFPAPDLMCCTRLSYGGAGQEHTNPHGNVHKVTPTRTRIQSRDGHALLCGRQILKPPARTGGGFTSARNPFCGGRQAVRAPRPQDRLPKPAGYPFPRPQNPSAPEFLYSAAAVSRFAAPQTYLTGAYCAAA